MNKIKNRAKRGFTFMEIVVVVAVISLLTVISLPLIKNLRIQANEAKAQANIKTLADVLESYWIANNSYNVTLSDLACTYTSTGVPSCTAPYIDPSWLKAANENGKSGYVYSIVSADTNKYGYKLKATPAVAGQTGNQEFILGHSGMILASAVTIQDPHNCIPGPASTCPSPNTNIVLTYYDTNCVLHSTNNTCPPPSGSCPYIYVWNGKNFIKDNDTIPAGNPHEYTDFYLLSQPLVPYGNTYTLRMNEELEEISHLDKLGLIQVEHSKEVAIAPSPEGKIFTYKSGGLIKPKTAFDKKAKSVLKELSSKGNGDFYGNPEDYIILSFGQLKNNKYGARLILSADIEAGGGGLPPGGCTLKSIHVFVLDNKNVWQKIAEIHPHEKWDIWAVDLTGILSKAGKELKIKLSWTKEHKLDYCLLDTSKQEPVQIKQLAFLGARHFKKEDIFSGLFNSEKEALKKLLHSDNRYVIMKKGDQVLLKFGYEPKTNLVRDFIFVTEGYYIGQHKKIASR